MPSILLLGKDGQVGWELQRALPRLGDLLAIGRPDLDLAETAAVRDLIHRSEPSIIVNAAAYNDVDGAEREPELAHRINGEAPALLAQEAARIGALLVHYSTDYVFDGSKGGPYSELDPPAPINAYGESKLAGEQAIAESGAPCLVLRTSWVYSTRRACFLTKVLKWSRQHETLRIVDDQHGSPTWARTLAEATAHALRKSLDMGTAWMNDHSGVYHVAGAGSPSRFEFARAILELDPNREQQVARQVVPAQSSEFDTPATRPAFSALDCSHFEATFGLRLPSWRISLQHALRPEETSPGAPIQD